MVTPEQTRLDFPDQILHAVRRGWIHDICTVARANGVPNTVLIYARRLILHTFQVRSVIREAILIEDLRVIALLRL